jgi:hypothetical protein
MDRFLILGGFALGTVAMLAINLCLRHGIPLCG